jgi:DAK2 domain fusion protein YloV
VPDESLVRFRTVVAASLAELESRRSEVNDLNVFPVADGDTGDNMAMTMRAVLDALNALDGEPLDQVGREEVVSAVAKAALLGARGNSGVILSQIVRGAAEELASRPGELVDPVLVAAAFARAADAAYSSVRNPAEGTMLSAVRAMAHRVSHDIAHMDKTRLGEDATPEEQDALIADVLERALEAAQEAVERGPDQLAVLKEAGVVDAGAYGLTVIVAGVVAALRGRQQIELPHHAAARVVHATQHESATYRYCTNFAVTGAERPGRDFVPSLERIGDSVLVVGDEHALRVHVHTDTPDDAVALFSEHGEVSRLEVADMREQVAERHARLAERTAPRGACAAVAVATGAGMRALYEELGVHVLEGGPTMNPSTRELLAAIEQADGAEVVVLPNSPNVIMAAEEAGKLADRPVRVVPTRAPQEGLAVLVAFDAQTDAKANAEALIESMGSLSVGGVAVAAKDDPEGRFSVGDAIGYRGDELVAWGGPSETLGKTLQALADGSELVTCIAGEEAPLDEDGVAAALPDGIELDYHDGGQPAWWWLLCAE